MLVGDVEKLDLPFVPGSFDVVLCGDLIEHLREPERFLARMLPLLRPDGRIVLTTPNVANWTLRLGLLAGRWRYTERGILDRTHVHLFTRATLVDTLARTGYRVVDLDFTVPVPSLGTPCCRTHRRTQSAACDLRSSRTNSSSRQPRPDVISVVIPVKDGGADLVRCLKAIGRQRIDEEIEVVVVDSGSRDGSAERAGRLGARVHSISPDEFHHGRTRNIGAEIARGDVLVFTSQDAYAADDRWLAALVAPLSRDEAVAGVYGRQLPHETARPPERYFLDFLYGPEARVQRLGSVRS